MTEKTAWVQKRSQNDSAGFRQHCALGKFTYQLADGLSRFSFFLVLVRPIIISFFSSCSDLRKFLDILCFTI